MANAELKQPVVADVVLTLTPAEATRLVDLLGLVVLSEVPELDAISTALRNVGYDYFEIDAKLTVDSVDESVRLER